MPLFFLPSENLTTFWSAVSRGRVTYAPQETEFGLRLRRVEDTSEVTFSPARAAEPLKGIFYEARGRILEYFGGEAPEPPEMAILDAKACDLRAMQDIDRVFLEDGEDPAYAAARRKAFIVSGDCTEPLETCFCVLMGLRPYPESGFDLNLSPVDGGFVVEVGSSKGEAFVQENSGTFQDVSEAQLKQRDARRREVLAKFEEKKKLYPFAPSLHDAVKSQYEADIWKDLAEHCVECGACNLVCPNCYCFLLYDQRRGDRYERVRVWDSCQYRGFGQEGGGANPRKFLYQRVRNRFFHKFVWFYENYGVYKCVGCGRCVEACMAGEKIDIREVLKELSSAGA